VTFSLPFRIVDSLPQSNYPNFDFLCTYNSYMGKQCADLDLLKQFQIYELVLKHEDGEEDNLMMQLDETMRYAFFDYFV
jgi:hypothetical protein